MSQSANLRSLQTLEDLKSALGRFRGEAQEALLAIEQEIRRTLDWLQERQNHWQHQVRRRQDDVHRAAAALARCQASGYYDREGRYYPPNCTREEQVLRQAEVQLRQAEAELHNVGQWLRQVQQAVTDYQLHARRLRELATTHTEKSQTYLGRVITDLQLYLTVASPGTAAPASSDEWLLSRMEQGPVDLARKAEWGKFAHRAYEEEMEKAFPDRARSEVRVRVTKADGTEKHGRIDSLLDQTIIDYKTHDLDRLEQDGKLASELDKIVRQLQEYCASPDTPPDANPVIVFEFSPANPVTRQFIEEYLRDQQVLA